MALATSSVESLPPSPRRVRVAAATGPVGHRFCPFNPTLRSRIVCDLFGHVERRIFPTHIISPDATFGDDASDGGFKTRGHFSFFEPVEHQLCGQEHGDGIDLVLTGVFRRRPMRRFEYGVVVAEIGAGREPESTDQAGA